MAKVDQEAIQAFNDFKLGKGVAGSSTYLHFRMQSGGNIQLQRASEPHATFDDFVNSLSETEACWAIVGIQFQMQGGAQRSKLVFVNWIPGTCPPKEKMSYAMFVGALTSSLTGIHCKMQANSRADLEWTEVLQRASRFESGQVLDE
jgi:hypothetical protein